MSLKNTRNASRATSLQSKTNSVFFTNQNPQEPSEVRFPRPDAPFLPRSPSRLEMMGRRVGSAYVVLYVLVCKLLVSNLGDYVSDSETVEYTSAIGDPGMRNPN